MPSPIDVFFDIYSIIIGWLLAHPSETAWMLIVVGVVYTSYPKLIKLTKK